MYFCNQHKPSWFTLYEADLIPFTLEAVLWQKPSERAHKLLRNTYLLLAISPWDTIQPCHFPPISRFSSFIRVGFHRAGTTHVSAPGKKKT